MEFVSRLNPLRRTVPNLVVAQRVIDKMTSAAAHFIEDETGEAMVGLLVPGAHTNGVPTLYVLDTIAPDESAVRQFHTFQQGDERQDELIWWLQENWRIYREKRRDKRGQPLASKWDVPLRYLGDWHKQPGFMIQPSTGDLMTARNWIADEENGMDFLLAPIVTLGHPALSSGEQAGANFVSFSQGDDTNLRADFWYIDRHYRDFLPICPSVYPNEQLPELPDYPWHLVNGTRFNAEYDLMEKDGLFTTLVLWDAGHAPPLDICFLTARVGAEKVLLLITPWNYPAAPPRARLAPYQAFGADDDLYEVFAGLWQVSEPVSDPPDWKWSEGRYLIDYIYALEEALGLKVAPPPEALAAGGGGSTDGEDPPAAEASTDAVKTDTAPESDESKPDDKPEETA
ncbi:MAG: hypothetical protein JNJ61_16820 [Anaerolineae bacterium]|nr:hypothetical protein [Anaerolineae bacterium]